MSHLSSLWFLLKPNQKMSKSVIFCLTISVRIVAVYSKLKWRISLDNPINSKQQTIKALWSVRIHLIWKVLHFFVFSNRDEVLSRAKHTLS